MTAGIEKPEKNKPLPNSLEELEQFVKKAVAEVSGSAKLERAAVYSRVSSIEAHSHSYSMEFQPDRSEEYVRSKGWQIVGLYADPDRSGRNSKRPDLQRMIRDIESGKVTVIVVHRLDRLYRNLESLLRFLRFLKKYRVRLVSVTEQIDTDSWWGRLVLYVLGALAEMYVWQTSVRVREIKAELIKKGIHNGTVPIGYCNGLCSTCADLNGPGYCPLVGKPDRTESHRGRIPVPHPVDRSAILLVHTLYHQGMSYMDIASYLNTHRFKIPTGEVVQFRTKGKNNKCPGRPYNSDSIREIICSAFYIGMVVRHPNPPLNMEDERVPGSSEKPNDKKPKKSEPGQSRRSITAMYPGRHQAIILTALWQANQQTRINKGVMSNINVRKVHEYLLSGIGYCWECYSWDGRQAALRGITSRGKYHYYRCATVQATLKSANRPATKEYENALDTIGFGAEEQSELYELADRHRVTLHQERLEEQINQLIEPLVIPDEWLELILAYYISDSGMSEFEFNSYNLKKELAHQRDLYLHGDIVEADYERARIYIGRQLQKLQPSARPEAREIIPLLKDFGSLWRQMSLTEHRAILQAIFAGLYFDVNHQLRKAAARSPFDWLLGLRMDQSLLPQDLTLDNNTSK